MAAQRSDRDAYRKLWSPPSGEDAQAFDIRFKEKGQARLSIVKNLYVKCPLETLPFFDKQGGVALTRDLVNPRQQDAAVVKYLKSHSNCLVCLQGRKWGYIVT